MRKDPNGSLGATADAYKDGYEDEVCDQCQATGGLHYDGCIYRCPVEEIE